MSKTSRTASWYTSEFIETSLKNYLGRRGFRLIEPEEHDSVVVSTRLLSKEVIEIGGAITGVADTNTEKKCEEKNAGFRATIYCLCLPDLDRYRNVFPSYYHSLETVPF